MRYNHPELRDRLAAEYALGTLRGPARLRLERLALIDSAMAGAIRRWESRLNALTEALPAVEPPPRVFAAIEREIANDRTSPGGAVVPMTRPASRSGERVIRVWRGLAIASMAIAAMLAIYIAVEKPPSDAFGLPVAVLNDSSGHAAFVASAGSYFRDLSITQIAGGKAAPFRVYQLWLLPKGGRPHPVGLVSATPVSFHLSAADSLTINSANGIAISLEPSGGSPTGQPTGPILFSGSIVTSR